MQDQFLALPPNHDWKALWSDESTSNQQALGSDESTSNEQGSVRGPVVMNWEEFRL